MKRQIFKNKNSREDMKRVIICDDDEKTVSGLTEMIDKLFPEQFQVSGYVSSKQLIYEIEDGYLKEADLLFLDLKIGTTDKMEVAKYIEQKFPVTKIIFLSNSLEYIEDLFEEIRPFGILLKPLKENRLKKYLERELAEVKRERDFVKIKKNGKAHFVPVEEVFYVESKGRKLMIYKKEEAECVYERISNFCDLYQKNFVRCHQSYAVNLNHVKEVQSTVVMLKNGMKVPVSRKKYREISESLF